MLQRLGSLMTPLLSRGQPALQFDGSQNYVTLGTMGTLGADIAAGFYASFDIITTSAASNACIFGTLNSGNTSAVKVFYNNGGVAGKTLISLFDSLSKKIDGFFTNATLSDGKKHTITITITPSTNTIVATLDGASQAMTYSNQQTPNTFVNFPRAVLLAANNNDGAVSNNMACTLDNFMIGVASNNLYGNYAINEGTGTTIADTSGKGNTGTLTGTPLPTWVSI